MDRSDRVRMTAAKTNRRPAQRAVDIVVSAIGLVALSPVLVLLYILIPRQSPGPAVFSQKRVGWREREFSCLKFRTMYVDAPVRPTHEVAGSHITPVGRVLRRTKLDELPQLLNVLRGEMSLVGPRPCLPSQDLLISERRRLGVFEARPGITGLAQVRGIDMSDPVKLAAVDQQYVAQAGYRTDFGVLVETGRLIFRSRPDKNGI